MEVLEYNYDYIETKVIICRDCHSKLQIVEADIEGYEISRYYDHSGYVKCPVCHCKNYVDWYETSN